MFQGWPKVIPPGMTLSSGAKSLGALSLCVFNLSHKEAVLQGVSKGRAMWDLQSSEPSGASMPFLSLPVLRAASGEFSEHEPVDRGQRDPAECGNLQRLVWILPPTRLLSSLERVQPRA